MEQDAHQREDVLIRISLAWLGLAGRMKSTAHIARASWDYRNKNAARHPVNM